jgi:hypothetical protein
VTVSVTVVTGVTVADEVTPGVPEVVVTVEDAEAPEEGVLPPEAGAVRVPEIVTDGVKVGTVGVEEDPLQAETATGARRVKAPQLRAVSLARRAAPAVVVRTFMEPSSCARQMTTVFPGPGVRNPDTGKEKSVTDLVAARCAAGRSPKTPAAIKVRPVAGADVQWPVYHRNIRLTE